MKDNGLNNPADITISVLGMKVVACARRLDKLESLADWTKSEGYPGKVFPVKCDLANVDDIKQMFEFIEGTSTTKCSIRDYDKL